MCIILNKRTIHDCFFRYVCFSSVADAQTLFALACVLTAFSLFGLGAFSSRFNSGTWYTTGAWVLMNGTSAAGVAYLIGWLMSEIVTMHECDDGANLITTMTATVASLVENTTADGLGP